MIYSTKFVSHNENGRKEITIERDATLRELIQRIWKAKSFRVSMKTEEVYVRGICCWQEKESGDVTTLEKAQQLDAIMFETAYFEHLMEHKL